MKKTFGLLTCFATAVLTTATIGLGAPSDKVPPIMFVEGIPVFQEDYKINEAALRQRLNLLPKSPLKAAVIENLAASQTIVYRQLLEAAKFYKVTSEEIDKLIDQVRGQIPLTQFQQNIVAQGLTWEAFLENLKQQLQITKLSEELDKTDLSEEQIQFFHANSSWSLQPLERVYARVEAEARGIKLNGELSLWAQNLSRKAEIVYPENARVLFYNPVIATVEGVDIRLNDLSLRAYYNLDFYRYRMTSPNQKDPYSTWFDHGLPQVLEEMINGEVANHIAVQKGLPVFGDTDQILLMMNTYQKRQVRLTEAEIKAYYTKNIKNYLMPAKAVVSRFEFTNTAKANAFRNAMVRGATDMFKTSRGYTDKPVGAYINFTQSNSSYDAIESKNIFSAKLTRIRGGQITQAFKNRYGGNLVYIVHEITPAKAKPLSEVRRQVVERLSAEKVKDWVKVARKNLNITNNYKAVMLELAKREVPDSDKTTPSK